MAKIEKTNDTAIQPLQKILMKMRGRLLRGNCHGDSQPDNGRGTGEDGVTNTDLTDRTDMKKVYLSGRMSGLSPETWRWRFASWEVLLVEMGYEVVNPADTIIARHLWLYKIVGYRLTLAYDLWLLRGCSHIFMVGSDWKLSKGARLERLKAREWEIKELNREMENWRK